MGSAVIYSLAAKLSICPLLALTLSLKFIDDPGTAPETLVKGNMISFLTRHGFEAGQAQHILNPAAVSGRTGECEMTLVDAAPQGWHRYILSQFASGEDKLFFIYRKQRYDAQPVWLTRAHHYLGVVTRGIGLQTPKYVVLGVVASPGCNVEALGWHEIERLV
jgi:hypothetical protein